MMKKLTPLYNWLTVLLNLLLVYILYMVTRVAFIWENWQRFAPTWDALNMGDILMGSLRFDTSAILYSNALWIVLVLLPLHLKEKPWWHTLCKTIFVTFNMICLSANLIDSVYLQYSGRRTTWSFFSEFSNEGNLASIFFVEAGRHWYLVLLGAVMLAALILLYVKPKGTVPKPLWRYYLVQTLALAAAVPLSVAGMRGGFTVAIRPITISNANQYVNTPAESAIVLNTPFSVIRTIGKKAYVDPQYMPDADMERLYSPLHTPQPTDSLTMQKKNVVVLIVESFARENIGYYNRTLDGGTYRGYTPFVDSLLEHSLTWEHTFANGQKSIDAMPAILSSIPMFVEPFILTDASLNDIGGLARCLGDEGYTTAFYHGAENGSMGFQAFARASGFQHYYGRTEYNADTRFNGDADFDGTWAIWDEPFLQYYALGMSQLQEPFMTAVFTASSHHPFALPDQYRDTFPEGTVPIHRCIGYTDHALRRFFKTASQQPWYNNTIFVLTADHTNQTAHDEYRTSLGYFSVPILIFDPSGQLPRGMQDGVAQQIDIMPTLLSILGYGQPYIAFGKDLLGDNGRWAVNYSNGFYQYVEGDNLLLFDGEHVTGMYNYAEDTLLKDNTAGAEPELEENLVQRLKAIIQSYMQRMTQNRLMAGK